MPFERSSFYGQIVRELSDALQEIVGISEAEGFISLAANRIADKMNKDYQLALNLDQIPRSRLSEVLIDLKRRIGGRFVVDHEDENVIVLSNSRCPFGGDICG